MKRLTTDFYKELGAVRDRYGETEYHRDEILPATMALVSKYIDDDRDLLRDAANTILDNADRADDKASAGMFPHFAHVPLGEKRRIKRGAMNEAQLDRRKQVIDDNKKVQDNSWALETSWINTCKNSLKGMPPETKVSDVLQDAAAAAA